MPGLITHLYIAKRIMDELNLPMQNAEYILAGSIAPDAAYAKPDFQWEYKQQSHLRNGQDRHFHQPRDQAQFKKEITQFTSILKQKRGNERLFYLGYLIHLISDGEFILQIWPNLRIKIQDYLNMEDRERTPKPQYFHEAYAGIDTVLFQDFPDLMNWLTKLEQTDIYAVEHYLTKQDILISREWVIRTLREFDPKQELRFIHSEDIQDFVKSTVVKLKPEILLLIE